MTLSRDARARAVQLPAWNEALSLPRPWDQQWSLRLQQILAYETDLLEYPDLFEGSVVVESKVAELKREARDEIERILDMGGVIPAIESGYMKSALVRSMSDRMSAINTGEQIVVGLNRWTDGLPSPCSAGRTAASSRSTSPPPATRWTASSTPARPATPARADRGGRGAQGRRPQRRVDDGAVDRVRARPCHHRRVGRCAPRGVRRVPPGHRRRRPAARAWRATGSRRCAAGSGRSPSSSATVHASSSASPAWTATPTAPRSSRSRPATSASTSSTPASGSAPTRSCSPRSRRTPT